MSLEVAARAFEPFFTTKELASGTGLGLSTVHGIITQAGGTVILTSEPGVGTTFHIFIPATAAPAVLNVPAPAPRPTTPPSNRPSWSPTMNPRSSRPPRASCSTAAMPPRRPPAATRH